MYAGREQVEQDEEQKSVNSECRSSWGKRVLRYLHRAEHQGTSM